MTVKQAAARLEVSPQLIYGLIAGGKLKSYRVGNGRGVLRISEDHLAEYLQGAEPPVPAAAAPVPRHISLKHLKRRA